MRNAHDETVESRMWAAPGKSCPQDVTQVATPSNTRIMSPTEYLSLPAADGTPVRK